MFLHVVILLLCSLCCAVKGEEVCYNGLGCFTNDPPFGGTDLRPFDNLPQPPEEIGTQFFLDTRRQFDVQVYSGDMAGLGRTTFDKSKETKFIVHGFLQKGDVKWMTEMSTALLTVGDFNVIRVGWPGGSQTIRYPQAAADTQVVGAEIALFINNMKSAFGMASSAFHCIGHSLGAQTCGYIGGRVSPNIGRISGLDPAGPLFENTPEEVRLDAGDASFVDVIHSDAEKLIDLGLGIATLSGDVDFWPNDGINQPGCDKNFLSTIVGVDGIYQGIEDVFACSHLRSYDYYTQSITSSCPFAANPCNSYSDYLAGKCLSCPGGVCPSMGYFSYLYKDQYTQPRYYLQTAPLSPFCEYMVNVQVALGSSSSGVDGKLYLALYGPNENSELKQLSDPDTYLQLRPSQSFSHLTQYSIFPSDFDRIKLLWTQKSFTATTQYIYVSSINVWVDHKQKWYTFCGDDTVRMEENIRYSFYVC